MVVAHYNYVIQLPNGITVEGLQAFCLVSKVCPFISFCSDYTSEGQTALPVTVAVAVCVLLLVFIIAAVAIVVGVMVVFKRRHRDKSKVPQPEVETHHGRAEDDPNTDSNQSVSHISNSEQDDTLSYQEAVTEIPGSFKNSHPVLI